MREATVLKVILTPGKLELLLGSEISPAGTHLQIFL